MHELTCYPTPTSISKGQIFTTPHNYQACLWHNHNESCRYVQYKTIRLHPKFVYIHWWSVHAHECAHKHMITLRVLYTLSQITEYVKHNKSSGKISAVKHQVRTVHAHAGAIPAYVCMYTYIQCCCETCADTMLLTPCTVLSPCLWRCCTVVILTLQPSKATGLRPARCLRKAEDLYEPQCSVLTLVVVCTCTYAGPMHMTQAITIMTPTTLHMSTQQTYVHRYVI